MQRDSSETIEFGCTIHGVRFLSFAAAGQYWEPIARRAVNVRQLVQIHGPDWRFQCARSMVRRKAMDAGVSEDSQSGNVTDLWVALPEDLVLQALFELLWHEATGSESDHLNPAWVAAVRGAQEIESDRKIRLQVESLLLADVPVQEIAEFTGLPSSAIAEYERCFFDVRAYLSARDRIVAWIERSTEDLHHRIVKKQSYFGGHFVAMYWLKELPHLGQGTTHDLATLEGRQRERLELILLQESIDCSQVPDKVIVELDGQFQRPRDLANVSDLFRQQLSRACRHKGMDKPANARTPMFLEPFQPSGNVACIA